MKSATLAAGLFLAAWLPVHAGVLISDDFESTFPAPTWVTNHTGALTADPLASGHGTVLHFLGAGSGGDLYSSLVPFIDPVEIDFDFLQIGTTNSGAYVGTDHVTNGFTGNEQWILNTGGGGAYPNLDFLSAGTWHHVSLLFNVYDPGLTGTFALKIEDNTGGGDAYFDNIVVTSDAPEPGTLVCLAFGLGGLALSASSRKRRS